MISQQRNLPDVQPELSRDWQCHNVAEHQKLGFPQLTSETRGRTSISKPGTTQITQEKRCLLRSLSLLRNYLGITQEPFCEVFALVTQHLLSIYLAFTQITQELLRKITYEFTQNLLRIHLDYLGITQDSLRKLLRKLLRFYLGITQNYIGFTQSLLRNYLGITQEITQNLLSSFLDYLENTQ